MSPISCLRPAVPAVLCFPLRPRTAPASPPPQTRARTRTDISAPGPSSGEHLALALGTAIAAFGLTGLLSPDVLVWIARHFNTSASSTFWLLLAAVRITVGALLITAAPLSRFPHGLRALGAVIVVLAILTLLAGVAGVKQASGTIDAWLAMRMPVVHLTALPVLALGGFIT